MGGDFSLAEAVDFDLFAGLSGQRIDPSIDIGLRDGRTGEDIGIVEFCGCDVHGVPWYEK